jgi:UDP:flavonoid glycosyltransferase YjiC (YdhE family)
MNVLFTSLREKSHFIPLLPFIEAFQKRGHTIAVAAPIDFAERVAATGAEFFPFGHPGDEGLRPIWMRLRDAAPVDATRIAFGELFAGACAGAALPSALETIQRWRPAIVVRESCEFAGFVAAEKLGVPHLRVAISARGAEDEVRTYAAAAVDAHRRSVGLSPDPSGERIHAEASLSLFPRSFDALETEPAELIRFRAERKQALPLPSWWGERQGPFVYVTLGTVAGGFDKLHAAYRLALDAVADLPIRVLLTIGSDLPQESLGEVPPNVHVERFVPQDDVVPHAAAVLCHGGSGTVVGALAAGVPMVVAPMFADQPHNAARVAAIGAGLAMPTHDVTAAQLRAALTRVLQEASFREASQRIAREIVTLPPVDAAGIELERLARG